MTFFHVSNPFMIILVAGRKETEWKSDQQHLSQLSQDLQRKVLCNSQFNFWKPVWKTSQGKDQKNENHILNWSLNKYDIFLNTTTKDF